jgi:cell wall-associated NlpC family hydrolase
MPRPRRSLLLVPALSLFALAFGWAAPPGGPATEAVIHVHPDAPRHTKTPPPPKPTVGEQAAMIALRAVGIPYRWGGAAPESGFDCSGLIHWAYAHLGVELPHSSYALYELGRGVSRDGMKPGDLLFFSGLGHVGLYLGGGRMVHAPRSGRNVEIVTLGNSHYGQRLVGARRIAAA